MITPQERWVELVRDSNDALNTADVYDEDKAIIWANERIKELEIAHNRYEALRKLNPVQFAKLYRKNIDSGQSFDSLVDKLAKGELAL